MKFISEQNLSIGDNYIHVSAIHKYLQAEYRFVIGENK